MAYIDPNDLSGLYQGEYGGSHDIILQYLSEWSTLSPDSKLGHELYITKQDKKTTLLKPSLIGNRLYVSYTDTSSLIGNRLYTNTLISYFDIDDKKFVSIPVDKNAGRRNDARLILNSINEYRDELYYNYSDYLFNPRTANKHQSQILAPDVFVDNDNLIFVNKAYHDNIEFYMAEIEGNFIYTRKIIDFDVTYDTTINISDGIINITTCYPEDYGYEIDISSCNYETKDCQAPIRIETKIDQRNNILVQVVNNTLFVLSVEDKTLYIYSIPERTLIKDIKIDSKIRDYHSARLYVTETDIYIVSKPKFHSKKINVEIFSL